MSCINVSVSKACRGFNVLACVPLHTSVHMGEDLRVEVLAENSDAKYSVETAYTPMSARVSRVCKLGVVDDGYELFYLRNGNRYLLYDGKTFRVVKNHDESYQSKYTGEQVENILGKAEDMEVPTKVSDLENDMWYATTEDVQAAIQQAVLNEIHSDL